MLAPMPSQVGAARRLRQQHPGLSYEPAAAAASPTVMIIANTFILWLLGAAGILGIAAALQKRSRRHRLQAERSTNHAA